MLTLPTGVFRRKLWNTSYIIPIALYFWAVIPQYGVWDLTLRSVPIDIFVSVCQ